MPASNIDFKRVDCFSVSGPTLISVIGACIARLHALPAQVVLETERSFVSLGNLLALLVDDVERRKDFHRVVMPSVA